MQAARQSHAPWCVYGWCRNTYATTKGPTGFYPLELLPGGGLLRWAAPFTLGRGHDGPRLVHREMDRVRRRHGQRAVLRERRLTNEVLECATGMNWARGTYGSKCAVPNDRTPGLSAPVGGTPDAGHASRMLSGICLLPRPVLKNPVRRSCRGFCLMAVTHIETATRALLHHGFSVMTEARAEGNEQGFAGLCLHQNNPAPSFGGRCQGGHD